MWFEQLAALYSSSDIPLFHAHRYTDIVIYLNGSGMFAHAYSERLQTLIPVSEESASRTSAVAPHPLSDKLLYLSDEYSKIHHSEYLSVISRWADSECSTPHLRAVRDYISRGTLAADISALPHDRDTSVRFVVDGTPLWQDSELISAHITNTESTAKNIGLCRLTGISAPLCSSHQKHIISSSNSAKLISSEHRSRLIHHSRFTSPQDIFPISSRISFKAHTVLRRIISERGFSAGDRTFAAWDCTGGLPLPFSSKNPQPQGSVTVIGMTAATQGRLSITFVRYLSAELYTSACDHWHRLHVTPMEIANAAFGHRGVNRLMCHDGVYGQTAERLLGCLLDGVSFPTDILRELLRKDPQLHQKLTETGVLHEQAGL